MKDPAFVRVIQGPVGSGKSVCCSHELIHLALNQKPNKDGVRKSRTLIVRNTADQLRSTTQKTFFDWFPSGEWGHYKISERTMYMQHRLDDGSRLAAEFMFLPLDTPDDVRKALSLEATFLWGNEWRELHPDVVDGLLMRLKRYPSRKDGGFTRSCAIFDTNPPDMDTWHFDKLENPPTNWAIYTQPPAILSHEEWVNQTTEEPDDDQAVEDSRKIKWWVNPQADNIDHLDPTYYPEIIPGKTEDFINVYLRCRYGRSLSGIPVYDRTFDPEYHIADTPFIPLKSDEYPIIIGLDFGRTPAAVMLQRNVHGQVVALAEVTSTNMGIETFLRTKLRPLLSSQFTGCTFIVAPDPAGWAKQQIGEISPVDVLKAEGFKVTKPATNNPELRIQSVERLLSLNIGKRPGYIVNPDCKELIQGFKFGYRYKTNRKGVQENRPEKNEYSHVHDANQYGTLVLENNQLRGTLPGVGGRREIKQVRWA